jgi:hypothetical protein
MSNYRWYLKNYKKLIMNLFLGLMRDSNNKSFSRQKSIENLYMNNTRNKVQIYAKNIIRFDKTSENNYTQNKNKQRPTFS